MILVTTTPSVDGYVINSYQGIVFGEVISGVNMFKDIGAGLRNMFGGRSQGYEEELMKARNEAILEMQQRAEAMVRTRGRCGHRLRGAWRRQRHADGHRVRHRRATRPPRLNCAGGGLCAGTGVRRNIARRRYRKALRREARRMIPVERTV